MTTLADITLKVAEQITDVLYGSATAGSTTSLTDTWNLIQNNQYWDKGTLWIRTGVHAGKVLLVTGFTASKLSFASLGATPISAADEFAVIRAWYPWRQIVAAVKQALDSTHVTGEDASLLGDGSTHNFVLPNGVYDVKRVELYMTSETDAVSVSNHWREVNGELKFDYGYAPYKDQVIHIFYRGFHAALSAYSTAISNEIDLEWLKYKAASNLLMWGAGQFGKSPEHLIEERMSMALTALRGKMPRMDGPDIELHTTGADWRWK